MGKMMMLVAAKWREFSSQNPLTEQIESDQNEEQDYTPKPSRSRATKVFTYFKIIIQFCIEVYCRF